MLGFRSLGCKDLGIPQISREAERELIEAATEFVKGHNNRSYQRGGVNFWVKFLLDGRGPLGPLLERKDIEEIIVNGINKEILVILKGGVKRGTGLFFTSDKYFLNVVNRLLAINGKRVDNAHPRVQGSAGKGTRISVAIPPYARDFYMTIRMHPERVIRLEDLVHSGFIQKKVKEYIEKLLDGRRVNIAIVGPTGSGKTTLLNAIIMELNRDERIIIVEDSEEINTGNIDVIHLIARKDLNIELKDAIIDALRLRPDRLIIGEIRSDEEVVSLRDAILASPGMGVFFTYHSRSIKSFKKRLMSQGFRREDLEEIDLVIFVDREKGKRKIQVVEYCGERIYEA